MVPSEEEEEKRALLLKDWSRFCGIRHRQELLSIDRMMLSQQKALDELKAASPELYMRAIQVRGQHMVDPCSVAHTTLNRALPQFDSALMPFSARGPTRTPAPEPGRHLVDGEYRDVTKQFMVQYADMKQFMNYLLSSGKRKKKKKEEEQ